MKKVLTLALLAFIAVPVWSQNKTDDDIVVVDDEECGCELFFVNGIQTIEDNGLFGFKSEDGTVIVEPKYKFVDKFHGDYCLVFHDYEQCGLINRRGEEIVPVEYNECGYPSDGMIRVRLDEQYGYFDTNGTLLINFQYRTCSGFSEGVAAVLIDINDDSMAFAFINKDNDIVIPPQFQYAYPFKENFAVVKVNDKCGLVDHQGRMVMPPIYSEMTLMADGRFFAVDSNTHKAALFDNKFNQLTGFDYEKVLDYNEHFFTVQRDGNLTYLDRNGKERFGIFEQMSGFFNGYSWVKRNGKYGIIDTNGRYVIPIEYDNSGYRSMEYMYSEGLFMVEKEKKYGFVDTLGQVVIPIQYQSAQHCTEGLIPVQYRGLWGFVDKTHTLKLPFVYDAASFFEWGRAEVVYKGEVYKINPKGRCVKNCTTYPKDLKMLNP